VEAWRRKDTAGTLFSAGELRAPLTGARQGSPPNSHSKQEAASEAVLPRTLYGMLVKPLLVSEEITQRSRDLPTFVALGAARQQTRVPQHLAAQLNKLRDCIEGVMFSESKPRR
jgi:hypothetical protein